MTIEVFAAIIAIKPPDSPKFAGRGSATKTTWSGSDPDDND